MKVETGISPETGKQFVLVLDSNYLPIKPVMAYLYYLENLERSPNTIKAYGRNLKIYWEFLEFKKINWQEVKLDDLAEFINWLRSFNPKVTSIYYQISVRTERTINQILNTVCNFDAFQARLGLTKGVNPYVTYSTGKIKYKPFLYGIANHKEIKRNLLKLKEPKKFPGCLTQTQVKKT